MSNQGKLAKSSVAGPKCGTCRHWKASTVKLDGVPLGQCRRYPPSIMPPRYITEAGPLTLFPVVLFHDCCGEHSPEK